MIGEWCNPNCIWVLFADLVVIMIVAAALLTAVVLAFKSKGREP